MASARATNGFPHAAHLANPMRLTISPADLKNEAGAIGFAWYVWEASQRYVPSNLLRHDALSARLRGTTFETLALSRPVGPHGSPSRDRSIRLMEEQFIRFPVRAEMAPPGSP